MQADRVNGKHGSAHDGGDNSYEPVPAEFFDNTLFCCLAAHWDDDNARDDHADAEPISHS